MQSKVLYKTNKTWNMVLDAPNLVMLQKAVPSTFTPFGKKIDPSDISKLSVLNVYFLFL